MIVVLAEKPRGARDIAPVLGANQKKDGYFEGNGYQVPVAPALSKAATFDLRPDQR
jgi:hypothetical protein